MFFELEDVKRRHMPMWNTNNVTMWVAAPDSTPSWNLQRGSNLYNKRCRYRTFRLFSPTILNPFRQQCEINVETL